MRTLRAGFTLLEMLAVIFLMAVVLSVAIDFYLDMSRASNAAVEQTRDARRAVVLLDRVARDLEGAVLLVAPDDVDPIAWPWLFVAEARDPDAGAERVKFVRRGHAPRSSTGSASDLETVAWVTSEGPDGDLELRRWSAPQLPDGGDRAFPTAEDSWLVAGGLHSFGIKLQNEEGEWSGRWDSSLLVASGELPIAAEIEVSFQTGVEDEVDGPYKRRVTLPLRPLDLAAQLAEAAGEAGAEQQGEVQDEDGDGDIDEQDEEIAAQRAAEEEEGGGGGGGMTVAQCRAAHPEFESLIEGAGLSEVADSLGGRRVADLPPLPIPIPPDCLQ
jgi:prepilin-type N-terminal cleavage/methylation domain-containing protein